MHSWWCVTVFLPSLQDYCFILCVAIQLGQFKKYGSHHPCQQFSVLNCIFKTRFSVYCSKNTCIYNVYPHSNTPTLVTTPDIVNVDKTAPERSWGSTEVDWQLNTPALAPPLHPQSPSCVSANHTCKKTSHKWSVRKISISWNFSKIGSLKAGWKPLWTTGHRRNFYTLKGYLKKDIEIWQIEIIFSKRQKPNCFCFFWLSCTLGTDHFHAASSIGLIKY